MERSNIIELARKNGATIESGKQPGTIIYTGSGGITFEVLERTVNEAVSVEREACAKACDDYALQHAKDDDDSKAQAWMMIQCSATIRNRTA